MKPFFCICFFLCSNHIIAQSDSVETEAVQNSITLSEVVVRSRLNVQAFLQRIKADTSFYKAFKNLRIVGFTALNDIRMLDKKGRAIASLQSKTRQQRTGNCRSMQVLEETTTGNIKNGDDYNYYTAQLYASLFFTKGRVCGETNRVGNIQREVRGRRGLERSKEQLKMLFFNPGQKIPGIPMMGDKLDIFDAGVARHYDYSIDTASFSGAPCYLFTIRRKAGEKSAVFNNIITWFDARTMDIVARNYDLSYNAGVYDFDVQIEVVMTTVEDLLVPKLLRYKGDWDVAFKKRERGVFTATLYDFTR